MLTHTQPRMDGRRLDNRPTQARDHGDHPDESGSHDGHELSRQQSQVLNVGRTQRLATKKQRIGILARQKGVCAAPGCSHTHLEIHYVQWWHADGGPTDIDVMIGLCVRCHHLVHRGLFRISGNAVDGFDFRRQDNRPALAAYRDRKATQDELRQIRLVALAIAERRRQRERPHVA